eukprot:6750295-Lingulodinium_polyedra.AAC.1
MRLGGSFFGSAEFRQSVRKCLIETGRKSVAHGAFKSGRVDISTLVLCVRNVIGHRVTIAGLAMKVARE